MLPTIKELNRRSRTCQKGAWGGSVTLFLLSVSLPLSFGIINAAAQLYFDRPQISGALFSAWSRLPGIVSALMAVSFLFSAMFAIAPLRMGQRAWYYGGAIRPTRSGKWITFWYKPSRMLHAVRISISLATRKSIWALILLSPAIILTTGTLFIAYSDGLDIRLLLVLLGGAALLMLCGFIAWLWVIQRYALVHWIAVKYPRLSVKKAVRVSIERMEGQYGYSLRLGLWLLLFAPLMLFGFPLLWIVPYSYQRRALWAFSMMESGL